MSLINFPSFNVEPDKNTYSEAIFFKTNLFTSINNVTNSEPKMDVGKYRVQYNVTLHSAEAHESYNNIFKMQQKITAAQPLWGQLVKVTTNATDATTIYVEDTQWSDFKVGADVALYGEIDHIKLVEILEVHSNSLVLAEPVTVDTNTLAIPTFMGYVKSTVQSTYSVEKDIKGKLIIEELI